MINQSSQRIALIIILVLLTSTSISNLSKNLFFITTTRHVTCSWMGINIHISLHRRSKCNESKEKEKTARHDENDSEQVNNSNIGEKINGIRILSLSTKSIRWSSVRVRDIYTCIHTRSSALSHGKEYVISKQRQTKADQIFSLFYKMFSKWIFRWLK